MEWKFEYIILLPLGWSILQQIQQGKMIAAVRSQLSVVQNNLTALQGNMLQLKSTLDTFVKTEIDTLKEIAESVKQK